VSGDKVTVRKGWRRRLFGWLRRRAGLEEGQAIGPGLYAVAMVLWPGRLFDALRWCNYDPVHDCLVLDGVSYSRHIFKQWATCELPTQWQRFISRENGVLLVESLNVHLSALVVKPDSVLVVKTAYPGDLPNVEQWGSLLEEMPQVKSIICLEPDWDVASLDVEKMRAAGWERITTENAEKGKA